MIRLLALDLDGTLVRRDGSYDPRDVASIARARAMGVEVAIATGRLIGGTAPVARDLALTAPMICSDGATLAGVDGALLHAETIAPDVAARVIEAMEAGDIHPFVCDHHRVHGPAAAEAVAFHTHAWSPDVTFYDRVRTVTDVTMTIGLGTPEAAERVRSALLARHSDSVDVVTFGFRTGVWAVRVIKRGISKGSAITSLARSLGIPREETACVGDWYNDMAMFDVVGRSFVMGGAPDQVAAHASDQLVSQTGEGGGIAEAIELFLGGR